LLKQLAPRATAPHAIVPNLSESTASPPHGSNLLESTDLSNSMSSSLGSLDSTTTASTTATFYTSEGTVLSMKNNWISAVGSYKIACYLCGYYGYGFNNCPNIQDKFLGKCCRCWGGNHSSKGCSLNKGSNPPIPFKKNFKNF